MVLLGEEVTGNGLGERQRGTGTSWCYSCSNFLSRGCNMHRLIFLYVCYIVLKKNRTINDSLLLARIILRPCEGSIKCFMVKF